MKKYNRIVIEANGGTDVLKTVEETIPEPQPGEVGVRVLAAGVGFADVMHSMAVIRSHRSCLLHLVTTLPGSWINQGME
jgi:NADPH:quinone reductase-like Zn-dependent oxidoreductase